MNTQTTLQSKEMQSVPSCIEIGLQAGKKGDFQLARQMLHTAMEQLEGHEDKQSRLIELITDIADTYLCEGSYDLAKNWYMKALHRCELLQGTNTLQAACLMARLAQVCALQSKMTEFQKYLDNVLRAYLLTPEEDISILLNPLIDLSWALCIRKCVAEVQPINDLIALIKQLEEEKLAA